MARAATKEKAIPKTDLVLVADIEPAVLFSSENETLETLLQKIKNEVSTIVPDVTTAKGRKEITANVSRVTKSKTLLDKVGKEYNAAQKELLKTFDSRRKHAFTFLEDLQKEVRLPLTEREDKEKARVAKCEFIINGFISAGNDSENWMSFSVDELNNSLNVIEDVTITKRLAEFEEEATIAKKEAIKKINQAIQSRTKYDSDQAELEKLRKQAEEADRLRFEADQKAKAEREAQAKVIAANTEKGAALKREEAAKEQAKIDLENAEKRRVADAQAAEEKRIKDIEAATQAEIDRVETERLAEIEAEKKRAANKSHKGKINRAIVKELLKCGIDESQAKKVVTVIAQNKVPNTKISY